MDRFAKAMMQPYKYRLIFGGEKVPKKCFILNDKNPKPLEVKMTIFGNDIYFDAPLIQIFDGINIIIFSFDDSPSLKEASSIMKEMISEREKRLEEKRKMEEERKRKEEEERKKQEAAEKENTQNLE